MNIKVLRKIAHKYAPNLKVLYYSPKVFFDIFGTEKYWLYPTRYNRIPCYCLTHNMIVLPKAIQKHKDKFLIFCHELGHAILKHGKGNSPNVIYKQELSAWREGLKVLKQYRPITKQDIKTIKQHSKWLKSQVV